MATCSKTPKSHTSLLMAGQHTSSAPLAWTMLHLASDTATADALYTEQDFRHLPLLDSCVRETLRMHPPIHSIMRQVREDVVVPASLSALFKDGVYVVPKDTYVLASPLVSQIDPQIWKDADKWNPTRWNDEQGVAAQALKTYTDEGGEKIDYGFGTVSKGTESPYQPFGAGKHRCIGEQFSHLAPARRTCRARKGREPPVRQGAHASAGMTGGTRCATPSYRASSPSGASLRAWMRRVLRSRRPPCLGPATWWLKAPTVSFPFANLGKPNGNDIETVTNGYKRFANGSFELVRHPGYIRGIPED
ncbi:cytochrome P450 [Mycena rebaudengoi]|nr:cytochrome P450 [Mycena rebaudengoi]